MTIDMSHLGYSSNARCEVEVEPALLSFLAIFLDSGIPIPVLRQAVERVVAREEVWAAFGRQQAELQGEPDDGAHDDDDDEDWAT